MNSGKGQPHELMVARQVRARRDDGTPELAQPVDHYLDSAAWVLLGEPGAGKTSLFESSSQAEGGHYLTVRNFLVLPLESDWHAPLFIDALDEMRAGTADGRSVLDQVRIKLSQLGTPKFRLSCREADWLGHSDSQALKALVSNDQFQELHLEPLSDHDIKTLVMAWQGCDEAGAASFVREAARHSLDGLLDNPQTLRMLTDATSQGWPQSKTETYAKACEKLAQEFNPEWQDATRNSALPQDQLLQAANFLFALVLLANKSALTYGHANAEQDQHISLRDIPLGANTPDAAALKAVLKTRLFKSDGAGSFMPVHRTVAEYLGAKHLASRIAAHLSPQRVLALMTGEDGGVVPELRGLHAWLAVHVQSPLRDAMIARDPLGVTLYGDVRNFSRSEKRKVLAALRDEASRYTYFRNQDWNSAPFGSLATADMTDEFKALLLSPDRSPAHQALLDCVLDAMEHGNAMPSMADVLEGVVRDASYWPGMRKEALKILLRLEKIAAFSSAKQAPRLKRLLEEISSHAVEDSKDELLGTLLTALYPAHVSSTEIWAYFKPPKSELVLSSYWLFWHDFAEKYAPHEQLPELLDALIDHGLKIKYVRGRSEMAEVAGSLLARGVKLYGSGIPTERLYRWLSLGITDDGYCPIPQERQTEMGQWLEKHGDIYLALMAYGLTLPNAKIWHVRERFYTAKPPPGFDSWCLLQAATMDNPELRRSLVGEAIHFAHDANNPSSTIELIQRWSVEHPDDAVWCEDWLVSEYPHRHAKANSDFIKAERKYKEKEEVERIQRITFYTQTLPSFTDKLAHLGALGEVADVYLGYYYRAKGNTPQERLLNLFDQNEAWVAQALHGLRQSLSRDDLPSVKEIIDLDLKGQRYTLAMPCLAAMDLLHADNPNSQQRLTEPTLEIVATFRLTHPYNETPPWFTQLVASQPELLARVLGHIIPAQLAAKKEHVSSLYALAHDPAYADIASRIVPTLLQAFPHKASRLQLSSLRYLILALMATVDALSQRELIAHKVAQATDVAQHVYWLTAGMLVAPELYLAPTQAYLGHSQARISHLAELIREQNGRGKRVIELEVSIPTRVFLIGLLGPTSNPRLLGQSSRVTPQMEMGRYVQNLIAQLGANPHAAAEQGLDALLAQAGLRAWEDVLRQALYAQRVTRRKALFQPATLAQVCDTLANLAPANAADLWALTVDHLEQLIHEIRHGSANDYGQYWAGDTPKLEDDCRDALLSDLRKHLTPLGIAAESEGRYADKKRADIKVIATPHHIPIEIKRESHPDLWKAIREQLVAKYGRESASDSYGIYLVFWFTGQLKAAPTDGGNKPKTAQELQHRLTAIVPEALKHKIAVLVVDCSKPQVLQSQKKLKP